MHFQHHAKPNCFRKDPDINMHPFFFALGKVLSVEVSIGKVLENGNLPAEGFGGNAHNTSVRGGHWRLTARLLECVGGKRQYTGCPGQNRLSSLVSSSQQNSACIRLCKPLLIPEGDGWPSLGAF